MDLVCYDPPQSHLSLLISYPALLACTLLLDLRCWRHTWPNVECVCVVVAAVTTTAAVEAAPAQEVVWSATPDPVAARMARAATGPGVRTPACWTLQSTLRSPLSPPLTRGPTPGPSPRGHPVSPLTLSLLTQPFVPLHLP